MLAAEGFEAVLQHAAQRLLHQVARDKGGGIDRAFLLAAAAYGVPWEGERPREP